MASSINDFKDLVLKDLEKLLVKKAHGHPTVNLGLKHYAKERISLSDKGVRIVLLAKVNYQNEMYKIIGDYNTVNYLTAPQHHLRKIVVNL